MYGAGKVDGGELEVKRDANVMKGSVVCWRRSLPEECKTNGNEKSARVMSDIHTLLLKSSLAMSTRRDTS